MERGSACLSVIKELVWNVHPQNISLKHRWEGDVLIVTTKQNSLLFSNVVAGEFLSLCDGNRTFAEIFYILADNYEVEEDVLIVDLLSALHDMQLKRIIYVDPMELLI